MYGSNARKALLAALKEAPEFQELRLGDGKKPPALLVNQLADRVLMELWHRGFAVSARTVLAPAPKGMSGTRDEHDAWRASKRREYRAGLKDPKKPYKPRGAVLGPSG